MEEIPKLEIRKFTKAHKDEKQKRDDAAKEIKELRKERFAIEEDKEGDNLEKEKNIESAEAAHESLESLVEEIGNIEAELEQKKDSLVSSFTERSRIAELQQELGQKSRSLDQVTKDYEAYQAWISFLDEQIDSKNSGDKVTQAEDVLKKFYTEAHASYEQEKKDANLKEALARKDVLCVHMLTALIGHEKTGSNIRNGSLDTEDSLKVLTIVEPAISVSTLRKDQTERNLVPNEYSGVGVIVNDGEILAAAPDDMASATVRGSLKKRKVIAQYYGVPTKIKGQFDHAVENAGNDRQSKPWNEVCVTNPKLGGLIFFPNKIDDYKENINKYFVGAKEQAENFNLPLYLYEGGILYFAETDENGAMRKGEEVSFEKARAQTLELSSDKKKEYADSLFENTPFKLDIQEYREVDAFSKSRKNYLEFIAKFYPQSLKSGLTEVYKKTRDEYREESNQGRHHSVPDGAVINLIKEVPCIGGVVKYFEYESHLYEREISYFKNNSYSKTYEIKKANLGDRDNKEVCFGLTSSESRNLVSAHSVHVVDGDFKSAYLLSAEKMLAYLLEQGEREKTEKSKNPLKYNRQHNSLEYLERGKKDFFATLSGVICEAEDMGDTEFANKARAILENHVSPEYYRDLIKQRLGDKGQFRATSEDVGLAA